MKINSGKEGSHDADWFLPQYMYRLTNTRAIDTLVLLGCSAAAGTNSIAYQFSNQLNVDRVIGATAWITTPVYTDRHGFLWLNSTDRMAIRFYDQIGSFVVYSSGNRTYLNETEFRNISSLIRAAG